MQEEKRQINEQQLIQMAQNEEQNLNNKTNILEKLRNVLTETLTAKEALNELQKAKGKMQIAIGATILIEVEVANTKTCKRGFAENGFKEESISDTLEWLTTKEEKIKKQLETIAKDATASEARLNDMVGIIKQIEAEKKRRQNQVPPTLSK